MQESGERVMKMMKVDDSVVDARMVMIMEDDVMFAVKIRMTMMINPCLAQDLARKLPGYYGHLVRVTHHIKGIVQII